MENKDEGAEANVDTSMQLVEPSVLRRPDIAQVRIESERRPW